MRIPVRLRWTIVVSVAVALTVAGGVLVTPSAPPASSPEAMTMVAAGDLLAQRIERAQERLRDLPGDWQTWASLGVAFVERARLSGDPTYYPRAENALAESLRLRPVNPDALIGQGMLANARHDFGGAATLATQAVTLNPFSSMGYLVLADAYTQLGKTEPASDAVQKALDLDPGLPALSRAAYDLELRGQIESSREMWQRALRQAFAPSDVVFVRQQLGDLALSAGDRDTARREYTLAGYKYGLAKLDRDLRLYAELVAAQPNPSLLAEYAVLLRSAGRSADADSALRLADAALALLEANGASDDLAAAEVALARGDCAAARAFAQRELDRRTHRDVIRMHQRASECVS
jgi:tetratricopeptide (TPR) repeat protein